MFKSETLISFNAHPDDEAVGTSTATEEAVRQGKTVHMVHVNDGGKTTVNHLEPHVSFDDIRGGYRRSEADAVSTALRIPFEQRHDWAFPDGRLYAYEARLVRGLAGLVLDTGAADILVPGLDVFEGDRRHRDHLTVRRVARLVSAAFLFHGEPAPTAWSYPRGQRGSDVIVFPVDAQRKAALLATHETQFNTNPDDRDTVSFFGQLTDTPTADNFLQYAPLFDEEVYVPEPVHIALGGASGTHAYRVVEEVLRARDPNLADRTVIPV